MQIGYIGLGKMGMGQVARLLEKGHRVAAWNRGAKPRAEAAKLGAEVFDTYEALCQKLPSPRVVWIMVSWKAVDAVLDDLLPHLEAGDTVIDGGNSPYKESMRRHKELGDRGIDFLDAGVSGGPKGAREGACIMVGGMREVFEKHKHIFRDLSADLSYSDVLENIRIREGNSKEMDVAREKGTHSYAYVGKSGAGHFVKMVHNGIEYGMMQAIGEGFEVLKRSEFDLDLRKIADLYNNRSVIESRLVGWLKKALREHGEGLAGISGQVSASGEGQWTVETARELGVPVPVIEKSLEFRKMSAGNPSYTGQVVSALRNQFGGHDVSGK